MLPFATNRFDFDDGISKSEIQKLCANPKIKYIQTRSATTDPYKIEYFNLSTNPMFRRRILDTLLCRDE